MSKVHEREIKVQKGFIPLIEETVVRLGEGIEFTVVGGMAWVLIPGSDFEVYYPGESGRAGRLAVEEGRRPPFIAFAVTKDTPIGVRRISAENDRTAKVVSYSVLCYPGGGASPYYAQGASPPRIVLPPKGQSGGTG